MKKSFQKIIPITPLTEGIDYYIENGYWVFTSLYHQKRGHCCQSGCRHCPYGFRKNNNTSSNL